MLCAGKVWSVSWDLAACGFPVNPASTAVFSARYDRAYVSRGWMLLQQQQQQQQCSRGTEDGHDSSSSSCDTASSAHVPRALVAVSDLGVGSVAEGCLGVGGCLPNKLHPSDHLPISITLRL